MIFIRLLVFVLGIFSLFGFRIGNHFLGNLFSFGNFDSSFFRYLDSGRLSDGYQKVSRWYPNGFWIVKHFLGDLFSFGNFESSFFRYLDSGRLSDGYQKVSRW